MSKNLLRPLSALTLIIPIIGCTHHQALVADSASTYAGLAAGLSEANPVMNPITMLPLKYGLRGLALAQDQHTCIRALTVSTALQSTAAGWNIGLMAAGGPAGMVIAAATTAVLGPQWKQSAINECVPGEGAIHEVILEVAATDPRPLMEGTQVVAGQKVVQFLLRDGQPLDGVVIARQTVQGEWLTAMNAETMRRYIPSPRWIGEEWRLLTIEDVESGRQQIMKVSGGPWL